MQVKTHSVGGTSGPGLIRAIEQHLRKHGTTPSRFGRNAVGDPRFVFDIRKGREMRPRCEARVRAYMETVEQGGVA